MSYLIEHSESAEEDISQAYSYYATISQQLAEALLQDIEDREQLISAHPIRHIRYGTIHCVALHRFPYLLHYQVDEGKKLVQFLRILHTSSSPSRWPGAT